jgi:2-polyprenyl-3-methyl-5-hydroxy-6-metoxy-1,4-benzoquinol methylase
MNDDMKRNDYTRMNEFIYPATDTLEIMTSAKRYNAFIEKLVIRHSPGAGKILDIGAGIGTFAQRMRAKGYAVRCIEPDGKQRKRIEEAGLPAHRAIEEVADHSAV